MRRAWIAALLVACSSGPAGDLPAGECPIGHARDAARAEALVRRLGTVPEGATLLRELPRAAALCFAPDALNVVVTDGTMLISSALPEGEAAARLGHLLFHLRDGLPMGEVIPAGADCAALVSAALDREARAYVVEARLHRALGVRPTVLAFEFEDAIADLGEAEATAIVRAYLEAHPTGAPGIDGLAAGYLQRCASARSE